MRVTARAALALAILGLAGACAPQDGASGASDRQLATPHDAHGSRGVSAEQADWLARSHTRPAGR